MAIPASERPIRIADIMRSLRSMLPIVQFTNITIIKHPGFLFVRRPGKSATQTCRAKPAGLRLSALFLPVELPVCGVSLLKDLCMLFRGVLSDLVTHRCNEDAHERADNIEEAVGCVGPGGDAKYA